MKDIKILNFSSCNSDSCNRPLIQKTGVNTNLRELADLEQFLLPYLNEGYRITHFSALSPESATIVLEKD